MENDNRFSSAKSETEKDMLHVWLIGGETECVSEICYEKSVMGRHDGTNDITTYA